MKKYFICLILALSLSAAANAQSVDQLMKKVSRTENIETVKIGGFLMALGKKFGGVGNTPVARGIKSLEIYDMSSCKVSAKEDLMNDFNKLKDGNGYETFIQIKDEGDAIRLMVKKEKNVIREMVFFCMDKDDPTIIRFKGKIDEKDIAELVSQYDK